MVESVTYTHKGWFGLCPIYIQNIDAEGVGIEARFPFTDWLIDLSVALYEVCFKLALVEDPVWPIKVTGELKTPLIVERCDES